MRYDGAPQLLIQELRIAEQKTHICTHLNESQICTCIYIYIHVYVIAAVFVCFCTIEVSSIILKQQQKNKYIYIYIYQCHPSRVYRANRGADVYIYIYIPLSFGPSPPQRRYWLSPSQPARFLPHSHHVAKFFLNFGIERKNLNSCHLGS